MGKEHFLVPIDAVESVQPDRITVSGERARLTDVPTYDPELTYDPGYYADLYGWWATAPTGPRDTSTPVPARPVSRSNEARASLAQGWCTDDPEPRLPTFGRRSLRFVQERPTVRGTWEAARPPGSYRTPLSRTCKSSRGTATASG